RRSRIWDSSTGSCLSTMFAKNNPPVSYVKYAPNGKYVLAGTLDGMLRLWGTVEQRCEKTYKSHVNAKYSIFSTFVVTHPKAKFVASGSEDNNVYLWDLQSRVKRQVLTGHT
ncbi:unnamed protein product, partial [Phaeothamnion confervicola]